MIERWLVMKCPLFEDIYLFVLAKTFGMTVLSDARYIDLNVKPINVNST